MIKLENIKPLISLVSFIDEKTNGALSDLYSPRYIGNLEDYILKGHIVLRDQAFYIKPLSKLERLVQFSDNFKQYRSGSDRSIGFTVPEHIRKAIMDGIYKRSSMFRHMNVIKTDADYVTVPYNNVQHLRWPGEISGKSNLPDPDPEYLEVNTNVALLAFTVSSKKDQVRARSIEEDYIEANIETLVEYFDRAILYGDRSPAKISGLYPKPVNSDIEPSYSYILDFESEFDAEQLVKVKNDLPVKYREGASWIMNKDTGRIVADMMELDAEYKLPPMILGIPVIYNDYMDSVDSRNSVPVMLVNMAKAYTFTQGHNGKGPSVRRFEEGIRDEKEEFLVLSRYRWGGKLTNPNAIRVMRLKNSTSYTVNTLADTNKIYSDIEQIRTKLENNQSV